MAKILSVFKPAEQSILRQLSLAVDFALTSERDRQHLGQDLHRTLRRAKGIGLAAPQLGQLERVIIIHQQASPTLTDDLLMMNPKILRASREVVDLEEGCLSIPGVYGIVTRPAQVDVEAFDVSGSRFVVKADELLARVIQHEIDHLDGILFTDHTDRITKGRELL